MSVIDKIIASGDDHVLEYSVPSRTRPGVTHKCVLSDYRGNGRCSCEDYTMNFEKYLRRGITPEEALAEKLIKPRKGKRPADALRCEHLIEARTQFTDDMIRAVSQIDRAHEKKHAYRSQNPY